MISSLLLSRSLYEAPVDGSTSSHFKLLCWKKWGQIQLNKKCYLTCHKACHGCELSCQIDSSCFSTTSLEHLGLELHNR